MCIRTSVLCGFGSAAPSPGRSNGGRFGSGDNHNADDSKHSHRDSSHNPDAARQYNRGYAGSPRPTPRTCNGPTLLSTFVGAGLLDVAHESISVDSGPLGSAAVCEREMDRTTLADGKWRVSILRRLLELSGRRFANSGNLARSDPRLLIFGRPRTRYLLAVHDCRRRTVTARSAKRNDYAQRTGRSSDIRRARLKAGFEWRSSSPQR